MSDEGKSIMSTRSRWPHGLSRRTVLRGAAASMVAATVGSRLPDSSLLRQAHAQSGSAELVHAGDFGLVGDGTTDDAAALQEAIDLAAERRAHVVIPPGAYAVNKSVELRTGTTAFAYGATLVTYIPYLGDPGTSFPTVRAYDAEDVVIHGLEVDGRRDSFAHSQWKHGFGFNNCRNVWMFQCHANRCKGDGVILENSNIGDVNVDVLVESCSFGQNYRMGGTASGALRAHFKDCAFWGTDGTQPMCGFDVEPDRPDVTCQDISFDHCHFTDNGIPGEGEGYGFNVSFQPDATGPQRGVFLNNCTMARNGAAGVDLYRVPRDIELRNCQVVGNAHDGIRVFADATNVTIRGGEVRANGDHGIHGAAVPDAPCVNVAVESVRITDNGWGRDEPANGIHLDHVLRDVRVSDCTITGSRGYGLFAAPTVRNLELCDNVFVENRRGATFPEMELNTCEG